VGFWYYPLLRRPVMPEICSEHNIEMTPFENETFNLNYKKLHAEVSGLSGSRCAVCGEVHFDTRSAQLYTDMGDRLIEEGRKLASV
jgi:YgiT-type zinc finger domain-containing protein